MEVKNNSQYRDKDQLKEEIYKFAIENINESRSLYQKLVPEGANNDVVCVNSEFAVECLRVVNENLNALIKLYAEINKADSSTTEANKGVHTSEIHKLLQELAPDPTKERSEMTYSEADFSTEQNYAALLDNE